jgi:histidinol-phosphate aminotransferase
MRHPDAAICLPTPKPHPVAAQRLHGGPDALGVPRFDFSTNSNACGPCPIALAAVQQADPTRYPDPRYAALRAQLAAFHGVEPVRVLVAGSASECIFRITAWVARRGGTRVCVPQYAYGDYAQAAQAWGMAVSDRASDACLVWRCEPSSPLGGAQTPWPHVVPATPQSPPVPIVLDCAYAPLRLSGASSLGHAHMERVWQMFSPNKALGLTGVRAAYAIAPVGREADVLALDALAPSWPLGAHGVAMLQTWVQPEVQAWLAESLHTLRRWKVRQMEMLGAVGWNCLPSDANFFCARPGLLANAPADSAAAWIAELQHLRAAGIKLRDTASFGLPGLVRLGVLPPAAQDALRLALQTASR